jgi:hypothetical protein
MAPILLTHFTNLMIDFWNYGLLFFLQIIIMINFPRYNVMSLFGWFDVIGYCYQISILLVIDIYFHYLQIHPEHATSFHDFVGKFI